jgi:hypothetical protein
LHLFYADKDSRLCRRILDFSVRERNAFKTSDWKQANLQTVNILVSHTSNFNLICEDESWYLGFTTPAGENATLTGSLDENDMTLNFGGLAYWNSFGIYFSYLTWVILLYLIFHRCRIRGVSEPDKYGKNYLAPTLVFISPDEKMEICRIGRDTGKEVFIKSQNPVFGSSCKKTFMLPYFLRLAEIYDKL